MRFGVGVRQTAGHARTIGPLAIASAVSTLNSLVIALVYARIGGAEHYGTYTLALSLTAMAALVALPGATMAAQRASAQGRRTAWPLFRARLPWAFAAAALVTIAGGVVIVLGNAELGAALVASGIALPLFVGGDLVRGDMLGRGAYREYLHFQILIQGISALAVVVVIVLAGAEPWIAVLALTGTTGVIQLIQLARERDVATDVRADKAYARQMSVIGVLATADAQIDISLSGALLGPREAGILAVARAIPLQIKYVWELIYQPFFRTFAAVSATRGMEVARQRRWLVISAIGVPAVIGIVAAPWLLPALFGDDFKDAVPVTQLLLVSSIVLAFGSLESLLLRAQGFVRSLNTLYIVLPLVSIVSLPILIAVGGLVGVGVKAILVAVVHGGLAVWLANRSVATAADAVAE
jgi:O-antigen/teichoic acid export membrane protein